VRQTRRINQEETMHNSISRTAALISILVTSPALVGQTWIKNPSNGHSYALQAKRMTWEQAEAEAVKHGGHLVTIRSNAEQGWIMKTFSSSDNPWIGLSDIRKQSVFEWSSGEPVTYKNWASGQPSGNGERYGQIMFGDNRFPKGSWNDNNNNPARQGIMERHRLASYTVFGKGCASTTTLPTIFGTPPKLGQNFTLEIKGFLPKPQFGQVIFGVSNTRWGVIPLPLTLAVLGMGNCNLLVSLDASVLIVTDSQGSFKTTMKVPSSPSLLGAEVYGQAWVPDPKSNALGVAMTNGFKAVVGY